MKISFYKFKKLLKEVYSSAEVENSLLEASHRIIHLIKGDKGGYKVIDATYGRNLLDEKEFSSMNRKKWISFFNEYNIEKAVVKDYKTKNRIQDKEFSKRQFLDWLFGSQKEKQEKRKQFSGSREIDVVMGGIPKSKHVAHAKIDNPPKENRLKKWYTKAGEQRA